MARILITGGAGYVGLPLVRRLELAGHNVCVIDNGASGRNRLDQVTKLATFCSLTDVTDRGGILAAFRAFKPEIVIHLAALHFIPECNRRPVDAVRVNVLGTQAVLTAAATVGTVHRVVVTSSAAVYPVAENWFVESDRIGPTDIYGITKATNEHQAEVFAKETGISTIAVRLFNVFGPGETNPHVLPAIIEQLKAGGTRLQLGNVAPKRSYVFIDDVVAAFDAIASSAFPDVFAILNVGNPEEASVSDLLHMMSSLLGVELIVQPDASRTRISDRQFLRCDPNLIMKLTTWRPSHTIREGIRKLLLHESLLPSVDQAAAADA